MKKTIRIIIFWAIFPISFPCLIVAWFIAWTTTDFIEFSDLIGGFRHFFLGQDEA